MQPGSYWAGFDLATASLYAFWVFFLCLILYINRESKREGYPLIIPGQTGQKSRPEGFPPTPSPKIFRKIHGGTVLAPQPADPQIPIRGIPVDPYPGSPLVPTGDPMVDHLGPAAYALRADEPDLTYDDSTPKIRPLRSLPGFTVDPHDPDPRGMAVLDADGVVAGTCVDVWLDRSEALFRFLEVSVPLAEGFKHIMIPVPLALVDGDRRVVRVKAMLAKHFRHAPTLKHPDIITLREEDQVAAYVAGGHLYAKPDRQEPLL
jgi:photosynthetic reaction center H subunit